MYTNVRREKQRRGGLCFLFPFVLLILVVIFFLFRQSRANSTIISPLAEDHAVQSRSILDAIFPQKNPDDLKALVKKQVDAIWNNYSVYVVDFNSPFTMGINESTIYTGASLNKVPILATLYEEAQKGHVNFNQIITLQAGDIQDYGTGSMRYDPPGTTYSVKTLTKLTGQQSDNTAAHILGVDILNMDLIQKYVDGWGMTQTDMANNKTSNKDMALLFRKIFDGDIVNTALTQELLGFLKDTDFEDRIPALLPKGTTVYHKVGTGPTEIHDTGIVVGGKTKYYIGILTEDVTDPDAAATLSAKLSKTVYDYMTSH